MTAKCSQAQTAFGFMPSVWLSRRQKGKEWEQRQICGCDCTCQQGASLPVRGCSSPLCIQKAIAGDISSLPPSHQRETGRFWGVTLFVCMWEADKLEAGSASLCWTKQASRGKTVPLIWASIIIFRLATIYTGVWKGKSLPTLTSQRLGAVAHLCL